MGHKAAVVYCALAENIVRTGDNAEPDNSGAYKLKQVCGDTTSFEIVTSNIGDTLGMWTE